MISHLGWILLDSLARALLSSQGIRADSGEEEPSLRSSWETSWSSLKLVELSRS